MISAAVVLSGMLLLLVFGEHGLKDLHALKARRDRITAQKEMTFNENVSLYRQIERLKSDPQFIEAIARKELGVIGEDELIIKLKQP
jgi:cell division protein FtsB